MLRFLIPFSSSVPSVYSLLFLHLYVSFYFPFSALTPHPSVTSPDLFFPVPHFLSVCPSVLISLNPSLSVLFFLLTPPSSSFHRSSPCFVRLLPVSYPPIYFSSSFLPCAFRFPVRLLSHVFPFFPSSILPFFSTLLLCPHPFQFPICSLLAIFSSFSTFCLSIPFDVPIP